MQSMHFTTSDLLRLAKERFERSGPRTAVFAYIPLGAYLALSQEVSVNLDPEFEATLTHFMGMELHIVPTGNCVSISEVRL